MIISCEHHSGMGLCQQCSEEARQSVEKASARLRRQNNLLSAASVCESEGLYEAARILRERAR